MHQLSHLFVVAADPIKNGKVTMKNETTGKTVKLTCAEMRFLKGEWPYYAPSSNSEMEAAKLRLEYGSVKSHQFTSAVKEVFEGLRARMKDGDVPAEYFKKQVEEFGFGLRMFPE